LFHAYLISKGKTTLEHIGSRKESPYKRDNIIKNLEEIFGPVSWKWLLPTPPPLGSGWMYEKEAKMKEVDPEEGFELVADIPAGKAVMHRRQGSLETSLKA